MGSVVVVGGELGRGGGCMAFVTGGRAHARGTQLGPTMLPLSDI